MRGEAARGLLRRSTGGDGLISPSAAVLAGSLGALSAATEAVLAWSLSAFASDVAGAGAAPAARLVAVLTSAAALRVVLHIALGQAATATGIETSRRLRRGGLDAVLAGGDFRDGALGSPSAGLFTLDDDDHRVSLWRPSLRAHQVLRLHDGIVAVSDLIVATSDDGADIVSRDLTGFMRLAAT